MRIVIEHEMFRHRLQDLIGLNYHHLTLESRMKTWIFTLTILVIALSGCDAGPNYAQLCKDNPEICQEFHDDSWCKKERIAVGIANLDFKLQANDEKRFNQLIAYENYEKCVSHASLIEHIKLKEKKSRRIENMMLARDKIKEISDQTRNSEYPRLLYFHWSRYLNKQSLRKFLALEGTEVMETSASQFELATYYTKRDQDKTLQLLFHALELYKDGNDINSEIFKTLSSIFATKKETKQAYIWLKVLQIYNPDDPSIGENTLVNFAQGYNLNSKFLDKVAETTLNKIKSSTFEPPRF